MKNPLRAIEGWLQDSIEGTSALRGEVQPLDLVRQIEREIERNKKVFINNQTLVPHKLVVHLFAPTVVKVEEYEALFNTREFREWVEAYIKERDYTLLDRLRIGIECHEEPRPEFKSRACFVEFSWPQVGADPADYTIVIDPKDHTRILSAEPGRGEVPVEAWLEVIAGDAYASPVRITRRTFNLGRTEHVLRRGSHRVLRINHLAFKPPAGVDSVNQSVSRTHAHITFENDAFRLFDDGSQNGTSVVRGGTTLLVPNGTAPGDGVELHPGDVIALGRARVRIGDRG